MPAVIVVSASASKIKVEPFKSNDVAITPVVIVGLAKLPVAFVSAGALNKFAIVISFRADALVSNNNKLSPVAGAAPKSV